MNNLGNTRRSSVIRAFLLDAVKSRKRGFISEATERFGVSRQSIHRHLARLVSMGFLAAQGSTRARRYHLGAARYHDGLYDLASIEESVVYERDFGFVFDDLTPNVVDICHYGFTEMVNNAIDHSGGEHVFISAGRDQERLSLMVADDGEGIFKRIARLRNLPDPRASILELSKGKLTTDPGHHTGEGVFFTSRMFDKYLIESGDLIFTHHDANELNDMLLHDELENEGTIVRMAISIDSTRQQQDVFNEFAGPDEYRFEKTVVPVRLALYEGEHLVSRSQAKRLMKRLEGFRQVVLDFEKVQNIGRSFADEVFRVWRNQHPDIQVEVINANDKILKMIRAFEPADVDERATG